MIELTTEPRAALGREPGSQNPAFLGDVLAGLRGMPKQLPCKYFYDERGSMLFDRICQLEEYYLTPTELDLMEQFAPEMGDHLGAGVMLVEYGSGSSVKTRYLLDSLTSPAAYVPVDISGEHLHKTAVELASDYPEVEILPVCADFTRPFELPSPARAAERTSVYFPGSTIGNFLPDQVAEILGGIAGRCGAGGGLLIGIDLKKDVSVIEAAYNDCLGVTAEFNLNLLARINRELGADFDLASFSHKAIFNPEMGRIEMHLVSREAQVVRVGGESFAFRRGETICTEYSHKYSVDGFAAIAGASGLTLDREWTDPSRYFAILHFSVAG